MKKNDLAKIRVNYNVYGVNTFKSAKNKHLKSNDILLTSTNYYNSMRIAKSCDNTLYIKDNNVYIKLKDLKAQLKKEHKKFYIDSTASYITIFEGANYKTYNLINTNKMIIEGHARDNKLADKLNNR